MKKITMSELENIMLDFNMKNPQREGSPILWGVIVYKQSNWDKEYSELSRSYRVSNANRHFQHGKFSNSLFGSALDGSDNGVRLDWYGWEVDYCYMEE